MMRSRAIITLLCMVLAGMCAGQDIHFSQFNSSPLNINPALTGLFDANARVVLNHRNQWQAVTVPFVTSSVSFDLNFRPGKDWKDILGLGMIFNRDKAGDSEFGTFQGNVSLSYTKNVGSDFFITYGMQAGAAQRSINYRNLSFDSQFNGDVYDPNTSTGENFQDDNFTFFDASAGLNFFKGINSRNNVNLGIALFHLNRPDQGLKRDHIELYRRLGVHCNADIRMNNRMSLLPGALFLNQGSNRQLNLGSYVRYKIGNDDRLSTVLYLGGWMRIKDRDALIFITRFDYNKLNIGLSYDVNFSDLTPASNYRGGLELSVIFLIQKEQATPRIKNIPCPIFM